MAVRNVYSSAIEDHMRKSVKDISGGNPSYLSYWKKVKILDTFFDAFSAESLRAHWILMKKKASLRNENICIDDIKHFESACISPANEDLNCPLLINSNFQATEKKEKVELVENKAGHFSPVYSKISYKVDSCSTLKKKNTTSNTPSLEKIEEIFENLVDICSVVAKKRLDETEVIQVLLLNKGRLQEVVNYFKSNN